ncbi:prolyl oligopeptidase family serine peptidase [Allosphingosinicella vermicomposti]|uniref:prolyl oligopeptidase family serine peptidase n=1 Tax=Allosphingosinicella vermicomposti TaxID=614671 RepID=UPI000D103394|nr:prolyl oligopeptidase family serine peptidase [Allosphingosinicella vermicomposti]
MRITAALLLLATTAACTTAAVPPAAVGDAAATAAIAYPQTARGDVVERQFGVAVADPYRWLENDVREDPKVREWVTAQNAVSSAYLAKLPGRESLKARLTALYDYERYGVPEKAGSRYFYMRNDGLQNQSVLYVRDGLNGTPRQLVDPNGWSQDGATALAEWVPSKDGKHLLYSIQEGGTDWRVVKVLDVATGQVLPDEVKWVKFSNLDWAKDGSGFYYSRFPEPSAGAQFQSLNEGQAVYFHKLGTNQTDDKLVFAQPDRPKLGNTAEVSDDGRWLIVTSSEGTDARYEVTLIDLQAPQSPPRRLVTGLENEWAYLGNNGTTFYWRTDKDAPRGRIVSADLSKPGFATAQLVPEDQATLGSASIVGDKIVASYLVDAKTEVRTFDMAGEQVGTVKLPGIGTAFGFSGDASDSETFFSFASFNSPGAIYRYDSKTGASSVFAEPELSFDPAQFEVEQRFYASKDGTKVPLFLVHKKGMALKNVPALLYGYGGFNAPELPRFQPKWMAWVAEGGVLAVANLRGGGEYGKAWHDAGRLLNKQNVFDDFIAAGEYLIGQGITSKQKLAIEGRSNGGVLVGAVLNQRPDLFAAALPTVGVMDMLRFDRFTAGRYWVDDYGYPNKEADFRNLYAYSPYHNIKSGVNYPPMLVTTADTDDRVVPGHSFKYIAAMQAAETGPAPHLIRIETRAGHGSGKPTDKQIEEYTDMYGFIAHHTGLKIGD